MEPMYIVLIISSFLLVAVYLTIVKRFRKNQFRMTDLIEENTSQLKELSLFKQKQTNPLGPLFGDVKNSITWTLDRTGKILSVDTNFQKLLGYTKKELIGQNVHGFLIEAPHFKDPLRTSFIQRLFLAPKLFTAFETELTTKSGQKVWISWTNKIIYDKKNKPSKVSSVGFDITKRKDLEADLQFLASIDPETGVLNRQAFLETGMRELRRTLRYKHPLSVLLIQFKLAPNNTLSTEERNNLLKHMAITCKKTIRDVDYLGRVGEVELAILLPETTLSNVPFLQKRLDTNLSIEKQKLNLQKLLEIRCAMTSFTQKEKSIDEIIINAYNKLNKTKRK